MNSKGNFYNPQNVEIANYMDGYFWAGIIQFFTSIPLDQLKVILEGLMIIVFFGEKVYCVLLLFLLRYHMV